MTKEVYYWDYLQLDKILTAQQLESAKVQSSPQHDEMLFIVTHQAHELWFKQILFEVDSICSFFESSPLCEQGITTIIQRLMRVGEIQKLLLQQINVLKTMTAMDFLNFRDDLTPASGLQSVQFRMLELRLGSIHKADLSKNAYYTSMQPQHQQLLADCAEQDSLWQLVEQWLLRMPFTASKDYCFWSDYQQAVDKLLAEQTEQLQQTAATDKRYQVNLRLLETNKQHFATLFDEKQYQVQREQGHYRLQYRAMQAALFVFLYRDQPVLQLPYQLLSNLVQIDDLFAQWRYTHILMVQRMIGVRIGTGGSAGYDYLKTTLNDCKAFADLERLATWFIPRAALPSLPSALVDQLGYCYRPESS